MDPDAALEELRRIAAFACNDPDSVDAGYLAELFEGLDKWIVGGGFLPRDWQK
jgi:hypothetical protein